MRKVVGPLGGENERGRASSLSAPELESIVRRLGFVAAQIHKVVMSRLMTDNPVMAEGFNDTFKPVVDYLIHFTVAGDIGIVSREIPSSEDDDETR